MDSTDFGESIRNTSAYVAATEYFESNDTDEMDLRIEGGNDRLIRALVRSIGAGKVYYRTPVRIVRQHRRAVVVAVDGHNQSFLGDACICTVPARVLNDITWDPPLPEYQRDAANSLQYARIMKTVLLYPERFWSTPPIGGFSVFSSAISDFCFESTYLQPGPEGIICCYAVGDKADDVASEPDDKLKYWITFDIAKSCHEPIDVARFARKAKIKRLPWQLRKHTQGAYALYRPGQWFTTRLQLQQAHDRVYFAGEHLADWQGFMEGAVNTGEEAADKVTGARG